jgi:hypothetical protein
MRMFKVKYVFLAISVVLALSGGWYYLVATRTPRGQPPLTSLTPSNLEQFKQQFNDAADRPRMVLLLSPT